MKNDVIEQFLSSFPNPRTQTTYRSQLKNYFNDIQTDPNKYFDNGRDYEVDIEHFWKSLMKRPPKSRTHGLAVVKVFLEEYNIELPKKFWRKLARRSKGSRAVTVDKVPTPSELKSILQHGSIQGKALFLMLSSSGMRIDEALNLMPDDIEMNKSPVRIDIPAHITKTGNKRTTFMSNEAKDALIEWYKVRNECLLLAVKRSTLAPKNPNDDRIFPFTYHNARIMWNTMIKHAKLSQRDKTTNRFQYHIHCLRKFYRSRMPKAIGVDMTEVLLGHEGYLTREYRDYPVEDIAKEYAKGVQNVTIFESPVDLSDVHKQLSEKDEEIGNLKQDMHTLRNQISGFQNLLEDPKFKSQINDLLALEWQKYKQMKKRTKS